MNKMIITVILVDDECGTDVLEELPEEYPELIQSVDIVAFNKV
jgi:translation elongation factor EF-1beta